MKKSGMNNGCTRDIYGYNAYGHMPDAHSDVWIKEYTVKEVEIDLFNGVVQCGRCMSMYEAKGGCA